MKQAEFLELIDKTANDPEVKKDPDLFKGLTKAYQDLDNGKGIKEVALKLDSTISWYLMTHEYKAPQAIVDLAKALKDDSNSFWKGTGIEKLFW